MNIKQLDWRRFVAALGFVLWLAGGVPVWGASETVVYNDGVWLVTGVDEVGPALDRISVYVGGLPGGTFTELTVSHLFGASFPVVYSFHADGRLQPAVPPTGVLGGSFRLTGYWDCYSGAQMGLRISTLDIQPNTKNYKYLKFTGRLDNGTTLSASDLKMKLELPNDGSVRMSVQYSLYALDFLCVDPEFQYLGDGFHVATMHSRYLGPGANLNDGARVKGYLGESCDCCDCDPITGQICTGFSNRTGYVFPYQVWMAGSQVAMLHTQYTPQNTPALSIELKQPGRSNCSVQGYTELSADPTTDNVELWANWDFAATQYEPYQKIRKFKFDLIAQPPGLENCKLVVP